MLYLIMLGYVRLGHVFSDCQVRSSYDRSPQFISGLFRLDLVISV